MCTLKYILLKESQESGENIAYIVKSIRYWIGNWDVIIIYQSKVLPLDNQKQRVQDYVDIHTV